jgi:hypothetical protein
MAFWVRADWVDVDEKIRIRGFGIRAPSSIVSRRFGITVRSDGRDVSGTEMVVVFDVFEIYGEEELNSPCCVTCLRKCS